MSNNQLKAVAGSAVATQEQDPQTFPGMLVAFKKQIAAALPKHLNADRMARVALTCFRLNPGLAKCHPASVFAAVIQSAQLGLEPGLNGRAYLIPYQGECQFVPGWKGLVELANRTGRASCWTGAVFDGDEFDYALGDSPFVRHIPRGEDDPAKLTHVYAIGRVRGNEWPIIEVWPIAKVEKHFKRFNKVGARHYAHANWEMYARKIPLLQVLKYLPASPELETAMQLNTAAEAGVHQGLTIDGVISGAGELPVVPDPSESTGDAVTGDGSGEALPPASDSEKKAPARMADDAAPTVTLAQIADKFNAARDKKDVELLDAHATLIPALPEAHRGEATAMYKTYRAEIAPK